VRVDDLTGGTSFDRAFERGRKQFDLIFLAHFSLASSIWVERMQLWQKKRFDAFFRVRR